MEKLEELLSMGFISQEEYETRKKEKELILENNQVREEEQENRESTQVQEFKQFDQTVKEINETEFPTIEESLKRFATLESQEEFLNLEPESKKFDTDALTLLKESSHPSTQQVLERFPRLSLAGSEEKVSIWIPQNW